LMMDKEPLILGRELAAADQAEVCEVLGQE
jgi:hypothetical protein